jgi:formate-dependent nitrite reductase membrane component NrfD
MDPKYNGQLQHDWNWLIAVYLFLGGVGAGAYTIAAVNSFMGEDAALSTTVGLWISFPALLIGCAALLLDLGSPTRAVLAGMKPGTSWLARGFWIISIFMILAFTHFALHLFSDAGPGTIGMVAVAGIVFAVMTMAYTGVLLGASKGIPFWRTGVVPVVFVVSALVTGHFAVMLGVVLLGEGPATASAIGLMAVEAAVLVAVEVLVIFFFLHEAYKLPDPRQSAVRILRRPSFVVGYFVLGLGAPLVLMLLLYRSMDQLGAGTALGLAALGAVLGLVGGLILRQAVLVCGALPTLSIGGFEFRRIARPKEPKPGIGMLPPQ